MESKAIKLLKQVHSDICENGEVSFDTSYAVTDFLMSLKVEEQLFFSKNGNSDTN